MSDNSKTQCSDIHQGGGALSTGASNSITPIRPRRRSVQRNNNGVENPEQNEVLKNVVKRGGLRKARQTPSPSNGANNTAERTKKKGTPSEASTSTGKRRKTSSMKKEGCASSSGVTNSIAPKSEATALNESKTKGKPKPKGKSVCVQTKKVAASAKKKQGEATTPTPRQFIGLFVYKEHNGTKILGSVSSYDYTTKLFKIGYDDGVTEYMEQNEVLKNMAYAKDVAEARKALLESAKNVDTKEQEATLGEGSTGNEEGPGDAAEGSGN